ncbi:MAG: homoserine dehydrogenase [Dehalococcoidia bacterium]
MTKDIGIALLGLGTVGSGVARVLRDKASSLAEQAGASLVLKKVLERDITKPRALKLEPRMLANHIAEVIADPEVDIVIEVIGGEHPALEYIKQAITNGKHVVTANKEVIAKYGYELLSLAQKHNVGLRYEASVGSGIPLISPFQQDLAANDISAIYAILNGTTNYILTRMSQEGLDFSLALKQAQELGYAEANPANDIEGIDAAYKLAILSSLAFHTAVKPQDIYCEGVSRLQASDFRYAKEFGYAIKLLAIAKRADKAIELRVHPVFIPEDSQLAKVSGVYNAIQVEGDLVGRLVFYGQGAGALPASSAIIADVLTIARNICHGVTNVPKVELNQKLLVKPMTNIKTRYYFRLNVADRPGVLAQISKVLGDNSISISSVIQKESNPISQTAVIVIMTHPAEEKAVQKALGEIRQLTVVKEISNFIRVEG